MFVSPGALAALLTGGKAVADRARRRRRYAA
jgi:hypothetical protein